LDDGLDDSEGATEMDGRDEGTTDGFVDPEGA
jgi:hypothetical protein